MENFKVGDEEVEVPETPMGEVTVGDTNDDDEDTEVAGPYLDAAFEDYNRWNKILQLNLQRLSQMGGQM